MEKEGRSVGWLSFNEKIHNDYTTYIHHRYIYVNGDIYEGILKDDQYLEDGQFLAQEL